MTEQVRVSVGTACTLGLANVRLDAVPTTAYLMIGTRCAMQCAFCAQARDSQAPASALSRITWPLFPRQQVILALADAFSKGSIRRCCLQVTVSEGSFSQTLAMLQSIRSACRVPVDASFLPRDMRQVEALFAAGLDHLGLGLDAACQGIFQKTKGGRWDRMWAVMEATARQFPGQVAAHLIIGLGETEREALETIQALHHLGIIVGLFAFTPVPGTPLADRPPPPLDAYRRIQAARWLIVHDMLSLADLAFEADGRLRHFGKPDWQATLATGEAFRTSGCPDCNRPYYNERPSGTMYNYPWPLTHEEASTALDECGVVDPYQRAVLTRRAEAVRYGEATQHARRLTDA